MSDSAEHPVEVLWRMQQQAMSAGHTLPEQERDDPKWGGLAFGVGEHRLVAELTSVVDVLDCPAITPLPGTRPWLRGICNVRGKLYSVVDLAHFLGDSGFTAESEGKLLVINDDDLGATLLIPKIFGLRYFSDDQISEVGPEPDPRLRPFIDRNYDQGGQLWGVLALDRLIIDERFLGVQRSTTN